MDIEARKRKIRKTRLIYYPVLFLTLFMLINSFLKAGYKAASQHTIIELYDYIYKFIPPLKWVRGISPGFYIDNMLSLESILSILILGLFCFSALKIHNSNTESTRLKKLKQEVDDEDLKNQFRKKNQL
ncbi:MAG: hypothetical protein KQH79_12855 [Bacteroidetes bacterium]|nr:hypothetical protein [Bacteroidota bacterium]